MRGHAVVVDVGKTLSKASLWTPAGMLVARRERPNLRVQGPGYAALDAGGIEEWLAGTLREFGKLAPIAAIVPVAHGAAMAVVRDGRLQLPPMDYENPIPAAERSRYDAGRDSFAATGSPALPDGLNLGAQLHWLEKLHPHCLRPGAVLLPWAQYWAWRLSGVSASEVTSLGCHTDLWLPGSGRPSTLAEHRGWAGLLAPLRRASECLGPLSREWIARTQLPADVEVYCGLHDSNAALLAAHGFPELKERDSTILSTGTWFVAMRSPSVPVDAGALPEGRDCLMNVDALGRPVPSARFMGGREIEMLTGVEPRRVDIASDQPALVAAVPKVLAEGCRVLPTFAAGCGPFPRAQGRWVNKPEDHARARAAVSLYAALLADVSLELIGSCGQLVIEGRFARAQVFIRALAALRPQMAVHVADAGNEVSRGALRLLGPGLASAGGLSRVEPLAMSLDDLRGTWRMEAERMELGA